MDSTILAAQPAATRAPPKPVRAPGDHRWETPDEYAAQVNRPVHFAPTTHTACGIWISDPDREVIIRSSDDRKAVTCLKCKRSRKRLT